jgi:hypothetical protein
VFDEDERTDDFASHLSRLQALNERRHALKRKLEQYRQLQKLLKPLKNPQESVQPNLVTRDSLLADELAKSKALGIRVAGGIARMNERGGSEERDEDDDIVMVNESQKLATILNQR